MSRCSLGTSNAGIQHKISTLFHKLYYLSHEFYCLPLFQQIINNVILFSHNLHSTDSNNFQDYKFKHNLTQSIPNLYRGIYTLVHFEHKEKKINAWHLVGNCFVMQESFAFVLRKNVTISLFCAPKLRTPKASLLNEAISVAAQPTNLHGIWTQLSFEDIRQKMCRSISLGPECSYSQEQEFRVTNCTVLALSIGVKVTVLPVC